MPENQPQPVPSSSGLISIERVVAFVLGPIVVAASGTISAAAVKWGFNVTPKVVEGAFITGGLAAGAAVWKWLQGRQKPPIVLEDGKHVLNTVSGMVEDLGIHPAQQQAIERQVLGVLEEHAHAIVEQLAAHITVRDQQPTQPAGKTSVAPAEATVQAPEPVEPIPPAVGDPAPVTPVPPTAPVPQPEPPVAPPTGITG